MKKLYFIISIALISIPIVIGIKGVEASILKTSLTKTTIKQSTLGDGLVAYWKLDEATTTGLILDSSGYRNHMVASTTAAGLPKATATTSTPTQIKFSDTGSVFFTGNKQILVGSTSPSLLLSQGVTMSMWYRATTTITVGSTQQTLLTYTGSNGSDRYGYGLYLSPGTTPTPNDGRVALLLGAGAGAGAWNTYASVRQTWTANTWYHILVTSDTKTYRIYVNGVLDSSGVSASIQNGFQNGIYMCGVTTLHCSGTIDDARIYNRALNPYEVTALYNASSPQYKPTTIGHTQTNFLTSGLFGYWTFDGLSVNYIPTSATFANMIDTKYVATTSGMTKTTMLAPGRTGSAISLNGSTQYLTIGTSTNYTDNFSVSVWVKRSSSSAQFGTIIGNVPDGSAGSGGFYIWSRNPGSYYAIQTPGDAIYMRTPTSMPDNVWTHLVFVINGANSKVYADGVDVTVYIGGTITSTATLTTIGQVNVSGSNYFGGLIDNLRIYNRVLTSAEINQLYLSGM